MPERSGISQPPFSFFSHVVVWSCMAKIKEKNPAAVALGRLGGKKGGPARMALISAEERQELARSAARKRWAKEKKKKKKED